MASAMSVTSPRSLHPIGPAMLAAIVYAAVSRSSSLVLNLSSGSTPPAPLGREAAGLPLDRPPLNAPESTGWLVFHSSISQYQW